MRRRRVWWLATAMAFIILDLAVLYFVLTFQPLRKGMEETAVFRQLGAPIRVEGPSGREEILIFRRQGSEWTGYRQTWTSFGRDENSGEMLLSDWGTDLSPPDWLGSIHWPHWRLPFP